MNTPAPTELEGGKQNEQWKRATQRERERRKPAIYAGCSMSGRTHVECVEVWPQAVQAARNIGAAAFLCFKLLQALTLAEKQREAAAFLCLAAAGARPKQPEPRRSYALSNQTQPPSYAYWGQTAGSSGVLLPRGCCGPPHAAGAATFLCLELLLATAFLCVLLTRDQRA